VDVCNYDAIHIIDGLSVVDYQNCIGCKACAVVCPRNIITMVPFKSETMLVVACSSQDLGNEVKEVCETGCIGCTACTRKLTGDQPIAMKGAVPVLDYDAYNPDEIDIEQIRSKCRRSSLIQVGIPTEADKAKVADEEVPDVIQAKFETTVDQTEYRG
jgi:ferredoxin